MVGKLCQTYGKQIDPDSDFYAFPSVEKLAENPVELESNLRRLGFGYRAKYIAQTAQQVRLLIRPLTKLS